jgi:hypothetical protein
MIVGMRWQIRLRGLHRSTEGLDLRLEGLHAEGESTASWQQGK